MASSFLYKAKKNLRIPLILALVAGFGYMFVTTDVKQYMLEVDAEKWPPVRATIQKSELKSEQYSRDQPQWTPTVDYTYTAGGKRFHGHVIKFQDIRAVLGFDADRIMDELKPGRKVQARYNPKDPSVSCLQAKPDLGRLFWRPFIYLTFAFIIYFSFYPQIPKWMMFPDLFKEEPLVDPEDDDEGEEEEQEETEKPAAAAAAAAEIDGKTEPELAAAEAGSEAPGTAEMQASSQPD